MAVPSSTGVMWMLTVRMVIQMTFLVVTDALVKMDSKEMERHAQKVIGYQTFHVNDFMETIPKHVPKLSLSTLSVYNAINWSVSATISFFTSFNIDL